MYGRYDGERERVVVVVVMMMMMVIGWVGWLVGWFLGMKEWKSENGVGKQKGPGTHLRTDGRTDGRMMTTINLGGNLLFPSFSFSARSERKAEGLEVAYIYVPYRYPSQIRLARFSLFLPPPPKQSIL